MNLAQVILYQFLVIEKFFSLHERGHKYDHFQLNIDNTNIRIRSNNTVLVSLLLTMTGILQMSKFNPYSPNVTFL